MTWWDKLQARAGALLAGTSVDELEAEQARLDAALARENEADRQRLGEAWFAEVEEQRRDDDIEVSEEIEDAFEEGWEDGRENVVEFGAGVGRVVGDVAGTAIEATGAATSEAATGAGKGVLSFLKGNWWWALPTVAVVVISALGLWPVVLGFLRGVVKRKARAA